MELKDVKMLKDLEEALSNMNTNEVVQLNSSLSTLNLFEILTNGQYVIMRASESELKRRAENVNSI